MGRSQTWQGLHLLCLFALDCCVGLAAPAGFTIEAGPPEGMLSRFNDMFKEQEDATDIRAEEVSPSPPLSRPSRSSPPPARLLLLLHPYPATPDPHITVLARPAEEIGHVFKILTLWFSQCHIQIEF